MTPPRERMWRLAMRGALTVVALLLPAAPAPAAAERTLDVLTYNIEGLGWPARRGRAPMLEGIADVLNRLLAEGRAPDVVLVQEMFSPAARRAVARIHYPYRATGPRRTQKKRLPAAGRIGGPYRLGKGELGIHLLGSGLAILSRFPIVADASEPFGVRACAGFDCLSRKGMLHAAIAVPGVVQPIHLFNTHMNAQRASHVPVIRHARAHALQVAELAAFLAAERGGDAPAILGGDFNMRGSNRRFRGFGPAETMTLVHRHCTDRPDACDVRMSWDGDEPWMDTQDLQLFASGQGVAVEPVRVEAMFDGSAGMPRLSDHDGLLVRYRLRALEPAAAVR